MILLTLFLHHPIIGTFVSQHSTSCLEAGKYSIYEPQRIDRNLIKSMQYLNSWGNGCKRTGICNQRWNRECPEGERFHTKILGIDFMTAKYKLYHLTMPVMLIFVKSGHIILGDLIPGHSLYHMEPENDTHISEFLLLGLSNEPELQPLIFGLFLTMYLITVFGNLLIILAISSDSHLHTPMYFFLSNLSFVDICFISTTIPKTMWNIQMQSKVITYEGCINQIYFLLLFAGLDDFLLTVMAYDRFVAICHPLHYTVIMNSRLCGLLVLVSWMMSALNSLIQILMMLRLSFCRVPEIPNFFCELNQVVRSACSDTFLNDMMVYVAAGLLSGGPFIGILYSYSKIVASIRGISSARGKYRAFSTCASHLSVVSLFYCTILGVYLNPADAHNSHSSAIASVMYTVVTPMLNPFIYSLRNKDIKEALKRFIER